MQHLLTVDITRLESKLSIDDSIIAAIIEIQYPVDLDLFSGTLKGKKLTTDQSFVSTIFLLLHELFRKINASYIRLLKIRIIGGAAMLIFDE